MLDVDDLHEILTRLHTRDLTLVEVETSMASPIASSLLFDYVATYMYEGDTPNAERRAAALSLDRDLLRELLGQEELRDLIDPGALEQVEADLQHRSDRTRADTRDELADVLRRVGDLTEDEIAARVRRGRPAGLLAILERERRAIQLRVGGEQRWVAADDAGLYRDALGAVPPGGLPEAFVADVPDALQRLVARYARTHGPFTTDEVRARYGVDPSLALERTGARRRPRPRRAASGRHRARVVRPRGPAAAAPRVPRRAAQGDRAGRPARARDVPALLAGHRPPSPDRRRRRPAARGARSAPGPGAAGRDLGARRPAAPHRRVLADVDGPAVRVGRGGLGGRRRAGSELGRVALYFRDDADAIGRARRAAPRNRAIRSTSRCASG